MKRTPLFERHQAAGAKIVPFAGWDMPVSYTGIVSEVAVVRSSAGIFDVSHMGEVGVTGNGAFDFVQFVTTNDLSKLSPGQAQYSLLLNEAGGVIDDIIVYCRAPGDFLLVLNAGCKNKDWQWLQQQAGGKAEVMLTDLSDDMALIAVQGPNAVPIVSQLVGNADLTKLKRFHFVTCQVSRKPVALSRTGYTGEDGFEIFCASSDAALLWNALVAAGATPAGLGARDVLRLEAAYPLYGHELDAETSPFESGVGWATKMGKGDFRGRTALQGREPLRQLAGLRMEDRAVPRENYAVFDAEGREIGQTTSGTWSPTLQAGIALARLDKDHAHPGTRVSVDIRGRLASASVVPLPFYRNGV